MQQSPAPLKELLYESHLPNTEKEGWVVLLQMSEVAVVVTHLREVEVVTMVKEEEVVTMVREEEVVG
ncbi:hypothetical protein Taro_021737 [Colocasia esculenta]|uniref:Uncharacterized protein n=1 Tax=Colocasia esculenta TaxID=4460 RepID=A0A843V221_COLES|nr:hypothetical protein [Colocasia esculenta]